MEAIALPVHKWRKIEEALKVIAEQKRVLVNERQAAKILGIEVRSLQNAVGAGNISPDSYTIGQLGKRFYYLDKLRKKV